MIKYRKAHPAFGGSSMEWVDTGNQAVAVYVREHDGDTVLILNNLSASAETVNIPVKFQKSHLDLFTGQKLNLTDKLTLQPYAYLWLHIQK
jgi:glycosidase